MRFGTEWARQLEAGHDRVDVKEQCIASTHLPVDGALQQQQVDDSGIPARSNGGLSMRIRPTVMHVVGRYSRLCDVPPACCV